MAFSNRVAPYVEGLIESTVGLSPESNPSEFRKCRDSIIQALRSNQHAPGDHFAVRSALEGLDEKFRVLGRDDLADALQKRNTELSVRQDKRSADVLALLLHLSDRPAEKTDVEDLRQLVPEPQTPPLTWEDIVRDDPFDEDDELWKGIDYAAISSGDDESVVAEKPTVRAAVKSKPQPSDEHFQAYGDITVGVDSAALDQVRQAQFWRQNGNEELPLSKNSLAESSRQLNVTELQLIREIMFMVLGTSTEIFQIDQRSAKAVLRSRLSIQSLQSNTLHNVVDSFCHIGSDLLYIRRWTTLEQSLPALQACQHSIGIALLHFDRVISRIQQRLLSQTQVIVSLIATLDEVRQAACPLQKLSHLLRSLIESRDEASFEPSAFLDVLCEQTGMAEMTRDGDFLRLLGQIFLDSWQTYVEPINDWMAGGELPSSDALGFFIGIADKESESATFWRDRYILRRTPDGSVNAPKFLLPFITKIFNAGKTIAFLKEIGQSPPVRSGGDVLSSQLESLLETSDGGGQGGVSFHLDMFHDRFGRALQTWIIGQHSAASSILCELLLSSPSLGGGVLGLLDTLEQMYFARDGVAFQSFAEMLFDKMDRNHKRDWRDRYILTEVAQEIYGTLPGIDERCIRIWISSKDVPARNAQHPTRHMLTKALDTVHMTYAYHWTTANIVDPSTLTTYQRILVLLQKTHRCAYALYLAFEAFRSLPAKQQYMSASRLRLRHRLLFFTSILRSHISTVVLSPAMTDLRRTLKSCEDVDAMASAHDHFITSVAKRCLLDKNVEPISEAIQQILDMGVEFAQAWEREAGQARLSLSMKNLDVSAGPGQVRGGVWGARGGAGSNVRRGRRRRLADIGLRQADDDSSDDDLDNNDDQPENDDNDEQSEASCREGSRAMGAMTHTSENFDRLLAFVVAGLRGISRAGEEPTWELLAERLDWKGGSTR